MKQLSKCLINILTIRAIFHFVCMKNPVMIGHIKPLSLLAFLMYFILLVLLEELQNITEKIYILKLEVQNNLSAIKTFVV